MTTAVSRFTKTATLRRTASGAVDEYGTPTLVESAEIVPCHVRRLSSDETPEGVTSQRHKLYLPPGTPLEASDRVVVDGLAFEVVEVPVDVYNPRTRVAESTQAVIEVTDSEAERVDPIFYGGSYS